MLLGAVPLSRFELARYLRRTMTGVECDLWSHLRANQVEGFKFRRKALLGPYIVDFACLSARLVVEIGGVKEKVLGAHRAGIRRVLLPAHNEADLDDIPADLRKQMELVLVESIDQVLREALTPRAGGRVSPAAAAPVVARSNGAGRSGSGKFSRKSGAGTRARATRRPVKTPRRS